MTRRSLKSRTEEWEKVVSQTHCSSRALCPDTSTLPLTQGSTSLAVKPRYKPPEPAPPGERVWGVGG